MSALSVANCHLHRGEGAEHIRFLSTLVWNLTPGPPENTARDEDLVVQLLRGPTLDHGALLVVHVDVVPHVVRGGNWTHVVYLQPHPEGTKLAYCVKKDGIYTEGRGEGKRNKEESE